MSHKFSKETLWHFQCGVCGQWWSIGDYEETGIYRTLSCPLCGEMSIIEEIKEK